MLRILQQFLLTTLLAVFASQASAMFIQPDWFEPTEPGVGTNRYSYSLNDPINNLDPEGNDAYPVSRDVKSSPIGAHSSIAIVTDDPSSYPKEMQDLFIKVFNSSGSVPGIKKDAEFYVLTIGGQNSSNTQEWIDQFGDGKLIGVINDPADIEAIKEVASGDTSWLTTYNAKFYEKLNKDGMSSLPVVLDVEIFEANKIYLNDLSYGMFSRGDSYNCHSYCAGLAASLGISNYPKDFKGYDPGTDKPVPLLSFRRLWGGGR
jgi:hypothetical protein